MEDAPPEKMWVALEAAENSYLDTLREFSGVVSQALAASMIRLLKGQLAGDRLAEDEIMDKIGACGELWRDRRSVVPSGPRNARVPGLTSLRL